MKFRIVFNDPNYKGRKTYYKKNPEFGSEFTINESETMVFKTLENAKKKINSFTIRDVNFHVEGYET